MGRQVRGELRKAANRVVGGAIVAAAAYAAYSQLRTRPQLLAPSPSPLDLTGAVRIACDKHATLIGFVLAGIVAGFVTAEEAESGAIEHVFLAQSSLWRIWFARLAAVRRRARHLPGGDRRFGAHRQPLDRLVSRFLTSTTTPGRG